jgi:hypothetical protein
VGVDDRGHLVASSCSEEFFSTSRYSSPVQKEKRNP